MYLPSLAQTSGPPESPSQASALSSMEPAQNMPEKCKKYMRVISCSSRILKYISTEFQC